MLVLKLIHKDMPNIKTKKKRDAKEEKKTKSLADLMLREQRVQRKKWRERTRKSRLERKYKERLLERCREDSAY